MKCNCSWLETFLVSRPGLLTSNPQTSSWFKASRKHWPLEWNNSISKGDECSYTGACESAFKCDRFSSNESKHKEPINFSSSTLENINQYWRVFKKYFLYPSTNKRHKMCDHFHLVWESEVCLCLPFSLLSPSLPGSVLLSSFLYIQLRTVKSCLSLLNVLRKETIWPFSILRDIKAIHLNLC